MTENPHFLGGHRRIPGMQIAGKLSGISKGLMQTFIESLNRLAFLSFPFKKTKQNPEVRHLHS